MIKEPQIKPKDPLNTSIMTSLDRYVAFLTALYSLQRSLLYFQKSCLKLPAPLLQHKAYFTVYILEQ